MTQDEAKAIAYQDEHEYVGENTMNGEITLEGSFSLERLKAIVFLMESGYYKETDL